MRNGLQKKVTSSGCGLRGARCSLAARGGEDHPAQAAEGRLCSQTERVGPLLIGTPRPWSRPGDTPRKDRRRVGTAGRWVRRRQGTLADGGCRRLGARGRNGLRCRTCAGRLAGSIRYRRFFRARLNGVARCSLRGRPRPRGPRGSIARDACRSGLRHPLWRGLAVADAVGREGGTRRTRRLRCRQLPERFHRRRDARRRACRRCTASGHGTFERMRAPLHGLIAGSHQRKEHCGNQDRSEQIGNRSTAWGESK